MINVGDDGLDCYSNECKKHYYVGYGKEFFLLVNWSYNNAITIDVEAYDIGASHLSQNIVGVMTALIGLYTYTMDGI